MEKISSDLIGYVENVVKTGQSVGIENIIVDSDSGVVRGIDEGRTVVLFQDHDVPDFNVGVIGLNRTNAFLLRLNIVKGRKGFAVEAEMVERDNINYAKMLHMESDDTKAGYRCANPDAIKAPKQINDNIIHQVQLNAEAVDVLQKGYTAYGTETVSINGGEAGVAFILEDISEDVMRHTFAEEPVQTGSFSHKYPIKTLLSLFKQNPDDMFEIGEKGILRFVANGLDLYVLPQV